MTLNRNFPSVSIWLHLALRVTVFELVFNPREWTMLLLKGEFINKLKLVWIGTLPLLFIISKTKFWTFPEKLKLISYRAPYFGLFGKVKLLLHNYSHIFLATMVLYLPCSCNKLLQQRNISLHIKRNHNFGKKTYQNTVTVILKNRQANRTNKNTPKTHKKAPTTILSY